MDVEQIADGFTPTSLIFDDRLQATGNERHCDRRWRAPQSGRRSPRGRTRQAAVKVRVPRTRWTYVGVAEDSGQTVLKGVDE